MITEPLVLIPGMMCDSRLYTPQVNALSARCPIMVIPPIGARTVEDLASNLLSIAPPRFALAGLSLGGIVAMEVVRQAPERVTRLALLDTNPLADPPGKAIERRRQIDRVIKDGLKNVMIEDLKPNYLYDRSNREDILELCLEMAMSCGPATFVDQTEAILTRRDQQQTLQSITIPCLIACGEQDVLCPVERHELMRSLIPNSQLKIVPKAGHMPTLEQPDIINEELEKWLSI